MKRSFHTLRSEPTQIKEIIEETIKKLKIENKLKAGDIINCWPDIVGKKIANKASPETLRNGRLTGRTENATWSQELSFIEEKLISKINVYADKEIVKKIIYKTK